MWFKKILKKFFKKNSVCEKCKSPVLKGVYCEECKKYFDIIEQRRKAEAKIVEENKVKDFIKKRDKFLGEQND